MNVFGREVGNWKHNQYINMNDEISRKNIYFIFSMKSADTYVMGPEADERICCHICSGCINIELAGVAWGGGVGSERDKYKAMEYNG